jgi:hypothetical protein
VHVVRTASYPLRSDVREASGLADNWAEAQTSLAFVNANYDYDWQAAEDGYRRAIALNPSTDFLHVGVAGAAMSPRRSAHSCCQAEWHAE